MRFRHAATFIPAVASALERKNQGHFPITGVAPLLRMKPFFTGSDNRHGGLRPHFVEDQIHMDRVPVWKFEVVGSVVEPEIFGKAEAFRDVVLVLEDQEGLELWADIHGVVLLGRGSCFHFLIDTLRRGEVRCQ